MSRIVFIFLFLICIVFTFFRGSAVVGVGGDEVVSYTSLLPFLHGLRSGELFPSFLAFFHEPMFQLVQLPMVFFGSSIFFVRLPNILFSILIFPILYKIGKELFRGKNIITVCLLLLYISNGFFQVYRSELNHSLFNLIVLLGTLYLLRFEADQERANFHKAFKFFLLSVFVYIDGIFLFAGLFFYWLLTKNRKSNFFDRKLIHFFLIAMLIFSVWTGSVLFASVISGSFAWQSQAPFSLIGRGTSYSIFSLISNIQLFKSANSAIYLVVITGFSILSLLSKKSRPIWALLFGPLIFFNLVKMPTVHLLNFFTLILVTTSIGLSVIAARSKSLEKLCLAVVTIAVIANFQPLFFQNPLNPDQEYKLVATKVRSLTSECEIIHTDLDGYTFRFYFNRAYSESLSPKTNLAVMRNKHKLDGFGKVAETKNLTIQQRNYQGKVETLKAVDNNLFKFNNTMTYVLNCRK